MITALSTLLIVSLVLLIASFLLKSKWRDAENQMEQISLDLIQHQYQTNKKLKVLEEELLSEDLTDEIIKNQQKPSPQLDHLPLEETVLTMHERGYKPHYIAKQTELNESDVRSMIEKNHKEGVHS